MGVAMLAHSAQAGDSMVCGKPSIREVLGKDYQDVPEQVWASIQKTAESAVATLVTDIERQEQKIKDLEAQAAAKKGQSKPQELDDAGLKALVKIAFGGEGNLADAAEATKYDCGYGDDVPFEQMDYYDAAYYNAIDKFTAGAAGELKDKSKSIGTKTKFKGACYSLLQVNEDEMTNPYCQMFCDEIADTAASESAVGGVAMGSPTYNELLVMIKDEKAAKSAMETEQTECNAAVTTIIRLRDQYVKNDKVVTESTRAVGKTVRRLNLKNKLLKRLLPKWQAAVEEDKAARAALAKAIEEEEEARINKEDAAMTLRMWEEHMAALVKAIEAQKIVVRQTEEALRAAEAASRVVVEFKNKLSTALTGLVTYYDESVRQPLRAMGIREEVDISSLFPDVATTQAAVNLNAGLAKTQEFCTNKGKTLSAPAVAAIEAGGAKLTAICDSQDWNSVSGEVTAAVNKRKQRAITNLENVQKKVVSYTGVTASKADGEVEGVWKAVAIYGDTDFATNYLSGWKFDGTAQAKGSNAGFMIELVKALDDARVAAAKKWDEAKQELAILEAEKEQVEQVLEMARKYLQEMIKIYEEKVAQTAAARERAAEAKKNLDRLTKQKEGLEKDIADLTADKKELEDAVEEAKANLKKVHDEALTTFMELLHASEQQGTESWD